MYDVIIIGSGPAGISASLYTARANLRTLVVTKGRGSLEKAGRIHNYYGMDPDATGLEILETGIEQARSFGVEIIEDEIVGLNTYEGLQAVGLKDSYSGRSLILAMGAPRRRLPFDGIDRFEGKGISYCVACDGFFYKGKKTAVIGYNEFMVHEAMELAGITEDITIMTNGNSIEVNEPHMHRLSGCRVISDEIKGFFGEEALEGVELRNGNRELFDGVFIAYGSASCADLAMKAGIITEKGVISTEADMQTNIPGIFAAGDCTGGLRQIASAVGKGAVAARSAISYLRAMS
ncbi:MAG TPA: NAD(P)/FAD-dependent oxidoreductase [Clostridia bacterium]|nr:NAD(P)/FAD-dependent oxidoreductase [Clostridia bacterium]